MKKGIIFMLLGVIAGILGQMAGKKLFGCKIFDPEWWKDANYMQRW